MHDTGNFSIRRIEHVSQEALRDFNKLLLQLSSRGYQMPPKHFQRVIGNKDTHVLGLYDGFAIVGTITLVYIPQITGNKGYFEDLVVDERYRGKGWGKKLVEYAIRHAKELGIERLELKSETNRVHANLLYQKLGFISKEATVYQMNLE